MLNTFFNPNNMNMNMFPKPLDMPPMPQIKQPRAENDVVGKWVSSYQDAQSYAIAANSQMLFINMNEAEIYSKVKDANGMETISTFTIIPKEKPKEIEKKEKQENLIENLAAQNNAILQELKNIQEYLVINKTSNATPVAAEMPIYGGK